MKSKPIFRVVPASQVKNNFGEVLKRVYQKEETQVIERDGIPVAGIVSMSDLERLYPEKLKQLPRAATSARRQRAHKQLMKFLDEMQKGGENLSAEEVEAEVMRAVEEIRYGKQK